MKETRVWIGVHYPIEINAERIWIASSPRPYSCQHRDSNVDTVAEKEALEADHMQ